MAEINYAERERQLMNEPTIADCERMGSTHFHYGWSKNPWGHWTDEQKEAYQRGFSRAADGDAKADADGVYDKEHADDEPKRQRTIVRR